MSNHHNVLPNTTAASIPLHCNICPKKPDFSDVSHLLTHIASKGHLSHYYKMKVKGSTDPASKRVVDEYDEWYDDWRVEDLMMERMNQKERKNSGTNGNANSVSNSRRGSGANSTASSRNTPIVTDLAGRRTRAQRESTLDPQLGPRIKAEPKSRSGTPASSFALDAATLNRSYAPPMQSWPATSYARSPMDAERSFQGSIYSTPISDSEELESPREGRGRRKQPSTNGLQSSFVGDNDVEFDDASNGNTKLKGVLWDGMGMFDSATPDMRRKRNQKKATSVVQQHPAPLTTLTQGFRNPFQPAATSNNVQAPQRNGMFGRGHQRQPSFPYGSGFRPANNNPLGLPPPNFGSFGQLNGQTMFQNHNPFAFPTGHQAFAAFQQQFTVGPSQFGNDNNGFQPQGQGQNQVQNHNPWDIFGLGQPSMGIQNGADVGFHAAGDFTSLNPLFFDSNPPGLEDDEATVSPPGSER